MSKSVLVIDTPKNCMECPLLTGSDECIMQDVDANFNADSFTRLQEGCPLREMPEKIGIALDELNSYTDGWNACIDAITGGNNND